MIRFSFLLLASFSLFLAGCGPTVTAQTDGGSMGDPDADSDLCEQLLDPSLVPALCDDTCVSLATDRNHCGTCGNVCDYTRSNQCVGGVCSCGEGFACAGSAVCTLSQGYSFCIVPDPNGETCDIIEGIGCETIAGQTKLCISGLCTEPIGIPEICDGFDNDLDGAVDNIPGISPPVPLSRFCYSGPIATEGVGICHGGQQVCQLGEWSDCNEQTPIPENGLLSCDGIDNNCDGCPDGEFIDGICESVEPLFVDIVYVIDTSGSMSGVISAVKTATDGFSSAFAGNPNINLGIIETSNSPLVRVWHPLTEFSAFSSALGSLPPGGGIEPSYDAIYSAENGDFDIDDLGDPYDFLDFRTDSLRIYVVFTDEPPTGGNTPLGLDQTDVCNALAPRGSVLAVFTGVTYFPLWDECGMLYELTSDPTAMVLDLDDIFTSPCVTGP